MKKATLLAVSIAAAIAFGAHANATTISQTLGVVDFTNGEKVGAATFNTTSASEPFPFNAFIGSDVGGPNFSASWTFNYGPIADSITSATLEIGLLDGDSGAPGNQVASYEIGVVDLTGLLNTVMEGDPGLNSVEYYDTVTLPNSAFNNLASGSVTVSLTLQGPGLGVLGTTPFNGAALDFSTITIDTVGAVTPLPAALPLFATGLGALGLFGWRRKRKAQAAA